MDAESRRNTILKMLKEGDEPTSATALGRILGVSRQIIVGDIALLRAQGSDITATARGYRMTRMSPAGHFIGKVACRHGLADTGRELLAIVELGGEVVDVIVDHDLYGEMIGQLNIATRQDVDAFLSRVEKREAKLLSELTGGVHLHTVACRDVAAFERIRIRLDKMNLIYRADEPEDAERT